MRTQEFRYTSDGGWSNLPDSDWNTSQTLVLLFSAPGFKDDRHVFAPVLQAFSDSIVIGCSTAGEIHNASIHDDSIAGVCLRFEETQLKLASTEISSPFESKTIGAQLASELFVNNLTSVFFLSDGINVNGSKLAEGFSAVFQDEVSVSGGLAGDGSDFNETWVFVDGEPKSSYIAAVGMYGDKIRVGHGSKGGWDIFGLDREITKSNGNILLELDGQPALELYKSYLGEYASGLPASALMFPLEMKEKNKEKETVRTILQVSEENNSMTFAGDLPEGSVVRLMRANLDRLIDGARTAAESAFIEADGDIAVIAISCVGRRLVLGARTEDELDEVRETFPGNSVLSGFYSYGEVTTDSNGVCDLHNQTMTITVFGESK